jgi:hypothetical protein
VGKEQVSAIREKDMEKMSLNIFGKFNIDKSAHWNKTYYNK